MVMRKMKKINREDGANISITSILTHPNYTPRQSQTISLISGGGCNIWSVDCGGGGPVIVIVCGTVVNCCPDDGMASCVYG
jgi:hypothetical protein